MLRYIECEREVKLRTKMEGRCRVFVFGREYLLTKTNKLLLLHNLSFCS